MNWEAANKTITTLGWIVIAIWIGIGIYNEPVIVISLDLESVKKNWVDELNNTEYMQRVPGSFSPKNIPSPNCDRHGCYNSGSNKPSW